MEKVLVLYNQFEENEDSFQESRSGVMDQVNAVANSLEKLGIEFEVMPVENLRHLAEILINRSEKLIFNLMEEFAGSIREACLVPALCESFGTGCTGNGTEALFLSQDKARAKAILIAEGLPCPAGVSIKPGHSLPADDMEKGMYIIKPACCDASEGIEIDSVVTIPSVAANERIKLIHEKFAQDAIVEQYIPSRELNVSAIETTTGVRVLPLAEIDFSAFSKKQLKLVDYQAKWIKDSFGYNNTPRIIPATLDEAIANQVRSLAIQAWQALGCSGYARVDFRLDEEDCPFVLEVNPNPDISPDAGFAAALNAAEIPYEQFVLMMLENAIHRRNEPGLVARGSSLEDSSHETRDTSPINLMNPQITIRLADRNDEAAVLDIIERTDFFRPVEIDIAWEVFVEAAQAKEGCTYQSYVSEIDKKVVGWICFGATPCTLGTFDIYWIAVDPSTQRQGIGRYMLNFAQKIIEKQKGRLMIIETSGTPRYEPTQVFYEKNGFFLAARIPDFYAPEDDKLVYLKTL
jgi:D-alanine-D-alanine ligase